jgi:hypothetical protein
MRYVEAAKDGTERVTWGPRPRHKLHRWRRIRAAAEWPWPLDPRSGQAAETAEQLEYGTLWLALDTVMRRYVDAGRRFGERAWERRTRRRMQARAATRPAERPEAKSQREWAQEYWAARRWLAGLPGGRVCGGTAEEGRAVGETARRLNLDEAKLREWMKGAGI